MMMTLLVLVAVTAQDPVVTGDRSIVSKCAVSEDAGYGYTKDTPIRVGGTPVYGASRQRRFLQALVGPAGQPVTFRRRGSVGQNADGLIIDLYEVTYPGLEKPIELYLDFYRWDPPKAPRGFRCGQEIGLTEPVSSDGQWEKIINLGITKSLGEEIPPVPLDAGGSTRYGVVIDPVRFIAAAARFMAPKGEKVTPMLAGGVRMGQFLIVAYPLSCDGQRRRPQAIDVRARGAAGPAPGGALLTTSDLARMLPWETLQDGSLGRMFPGATPPPGAVVITYDGAACPGDSPAVTLPIKAGPPTKIVDLKPSWPLSVAKTPGLDPVRVQIRATIDIEGVPTNLEVLSAPSEFNLAAANAVRQWRYAPMTINGAPMFVPIVMTVVVTFSTSVR